MFRATTALLIFCSTTLAFGAPGHSDSHDGDKQATPVAGEPGQRQAVDRTIEVDAYDNMRFDTEQWRVQTGETIEFVVTNRGEIPHEFVIDTTEGNARHRDAMKASMGGGGMMDHNDPNAVSVGPNETENLIWTFTDSGNFEAACNIAGHYEAGMHSRIRVTGASDAHQSDGGH